MAPRCSPAPNVLWPLLCLGKVWIPGTTVSDFHKGNRIREAKHLPEGTQQPEEELRFELSPLGKPSLSTFHPAGPQPLLSTLRLNRGKTWRKQRVREEQGVGALHLSLCPAVLEGRDGPPPPAPPP